MWVNEEWTDRVGLEGIWVTGGLSHSLQGVSLWKSLSIRGNIVSSSRLRGQGDVVWDVGLGSLPRGHSLQELMWASAFAVWLK